MTALHADDCSDPGVRLDLRGVLRCPSCRYIQTPPSRAQVVTGYVCRDHHGQPVRFPSGKGCTLCPKRKPKPRKASEPRDQPERNYVS